MNGRITDLHSPKQKSLQTARSCPLHSDKSIGYHHYICPPSPCPYKCLAHLFTNSWRAIQDVWCLVFTYGNVSHSNPSRVLRQYRSWSVKLICTIQSTILMAIFKYSYANWEKIRMIKISEHLLILTLRNIFLHFWKTTICVSVKAEESEMIQLCSTIQNVGNNKNSCNYCFSINEFFF